MHTSSAHKYFADSAVCRQVNAFFLKYILWIPPLNPLNTIRLAILFLAALPTAKVGG